MDVLDSGHLSRYGALEDAGFKRKVLTFEQELAAFCGVESALATSSGTASLMIALLALGIGEDDEVLVPGFTYIATIAAVIYSRATPVLVEIDESLTIDPLDARRKITDRTKAIIAVHMLGNPCDLRALRTVADEAGIYLVEDVAQAAGGSYRGERLGSIGTIGVFSLNRFKTMSAGEGGALITSDRRLYERAFAIHDQGHYPFRTGKTAGYRSLIGLNFKMSELTGAVALAQLRKLDAILMTLRKQKTALKTVLAESGLFGFRRLNDVDGECATLLTLLPPTEREAECLAERLGTTTLRSSGWHNYSNMSQIGEHTTPAAGWPGRARYGNPGDLPETDALLGRAVNISIGVIDAGIGASFGINIQSTNEEISAVAARVIAACTESRETGAIA